MGCKNMYLLAVTATLISLAWGQSGDCSSAGQLRLVDGANEREGRVEMCVGGVWGTICDDLWDSRDADVVCRQLGLQGNGAVAVAGSFFGAGTGTIVLDNIECEGTEETLHQCPHGGLAIHDCGTNEQASVICQSADFSCDDWEMRLVGGEIPNEGRLEVCFNNQFGTICDDGWDARDAAVVCGQLGFQREDALAIGLNPYKTGIGNIYLSEVNCVGDEANISSCSYRTQHDCVLHLEDAAILCKPLVAVVCTAGEVRLVGGRVESEGRVEVCHNDHWGTMCDDGWGIPDARVVCRQLGFDADLAIPLGSLGFGAGNGLIFVDNIRCRGNEDSIAMCIKSLTGDHDCRHTEDVGIVCQDSNSTCTHGDVRLVNGTGGREHEGRVEICLNNHWGTVCGDMWDSGEAKVVCNQLGFPGTAVALPRSFYGEGLGIVWMRRVRCTGEESSLLSCPHTRYIRYQDEWCTHSFDANVICTAPANESLPNNCTNGDVRLMGGSIANEGRVELCFHGHWGTVCSDLWDDTNAEVVCRQLGFNSKGAYAARGAYFGEGTGPILLDSVQCGGNESTLLECTSENELGVNSCGHNQDASVICPIDAALWACTNGDVRLRDGITSSEGRVEVCINGRWGTVCAGSGGVVWDSNDATVVCNQLFNTTTKRGFPTVGAHGPGAGPIFLNNLGCFGDEANLLECLNSGLSSVANCNHTQDVGVVCYDAPCVDDGIRLNNGTSHLSLPQTRPSSMGRVEVCVGGVYGTVSNRGFGGDEVAALCAQLGFQGDGILTGSGFFGVGTGHVYALTLSAAGDVIGTVQLEDSSHDNDAAIVCLSQSSSQGVSPGTVRLVGGASPMEGRVEVFLDDQWGTVCDDSFDSNGAAVVCRQLGLPYTGATMVHYGGNDGLSILFDDLKCTGMENSLLNCHRTSVNEIDCTHLEDVGVVCTGVGDTSTAATTTTTKEPKIHGQDSVSVVTSVVVPVLSLTILVVSLSMFIISFVVYGKMRLKNSSLEAAKHARSCGKSKDSLSSNQTLEEQL